MITVVAQPPSPPFSRITTVILLPKRQPFVRCSTTATREKIQKEGFSFLDMKRFLEAHGYPADGFQVSLDDLLKAGIPAIVLMVDNGYHHFVVVKGMRGDKVLLGDPAVGLRVLPREQFEASWPSRVVFVIHDLRERGEFNTARDWSVRPMSPLGRPLSPDTLNNIVLFRPGGRDF